MGHGRSDLDGFTEDEIRYLQGITRQRKRKAERSIENFKIRDGQDEDEALEGLEKIKRKLKFVTKIDNKLDKVLKKTRK